MLHLVSCSEVAKLLLEKKDINKKNKKGMTPLLFQILSAANSGGDDARQIVKLLIDNNADVDLSDETGQTPLWLASLYGNVEIVKMLIAKGRCKI